MNKKLIWFNGSFSANSRNGHNLCVSILNGVFFFNDDSKFIRGCTTEFAAKNAVTLDIWNNWNVHFIFFLEKWWLACRIWSKGKGSLLIFLLIQVLISLYSWKWVMTNSLVGDHQVAVVNVDEGVLEGSDMSGTHLTDSLWEIRHKTCMYNMLSWLGWQTSL